MPDCTAEQQAVDDAQAIFNAAQSALEVCLINDPPCPEEEEARDDAQAILNAAQSALEACQQGEGGGGP